MTVEFVKQTTSGLSRFVLLNSTTTTTTTRIGTTADLGALDVIYFDTDLKNTVNALAITEREALMPCKGQARNCKGGRND